MARPRGLVVLALVLLLLPQTAAADAFDLDAYQRRIAEDADLTAIELARRHAPFGPYLESVPPSGGSVAFLDSVITVFELTPGEIDLIDRHGFMTSERLQFASYGSILDRVWHADLPVFLSSDLFLHTIHRSFDDILKSIETTTLIPTIDGALVALRGALPDLAARYADDRAMDVCLDDLDLYTSVALDLLRTEDVEPLRPGVVTQHDQMVAAAEAGTGMQSVALFNETPRPMDFSQFRPRGHYTDLPELERYFRCMIWLGRTDFRLTIPPVADPPASVQREIVDAFLLRELVGTAGIRASLDDVDALLQAFIGMSDNTTLTHLDRMAVDLGLTDAASLWDDATADVFDGLLATDDYQPQAINSRIMIGDPMSGVPLDPPYAFLLMGQRFTVDSSVLGNVVYDRIRWQDQTVFRGLPDPLDVLYALGNDDTLPLLESELETYHYAPNLSAMRMLVDSYDDAYWDSSLYTHWVSSLRTLNATGEQDGVPDFMRTAAWQQQKMNTQLASWAELRHDTILYVKQSYTGGVTCSYPDGYVEPVPELYARLAAFARFGRDRIVPRLDPAMAAPIASYFDDAAAVFDTVGTLARKELAGVPFTGAETSFIQRTLFVDFICAPYETGWLKRLYFAGGDAPASERDRVIADVHTQPTDASGAIVGKVLHVATADPLLGVFVASCPGGAPTAFVGPVASYRELVTTDFVRLTDEDWEAILEGGSSSQPYSMLYGLPASEPWSHVYAADPLGSARSDALSILDSDLVAVHDPQNPPDDGAPTDRGGVGRVRGIPNPFNPRTVIAYEIQGVRPVPVTIDIVNVRGEKVRRLLDETMSPGNYLTPWDGEDASGRPVASGVYMARVVAGGRAKAVKLALVR